jgi:hypothetical protein
MFDMTKKNDNLVKLNVPILEGVKMNKIILFEHFKHVVKSCM